MIDANDDVTAAVKTTVGPSRKRTNTCGRSSLKRRMDAQLAGILAHLEKHPNDMLSRARVAKIREMGL